MDSTDFALPSPKRQKTGSPVDHGMTDFSAARSTAENTIANESLDDQRNPVADIPGLTLKSQPAEDTKEERDVLDVLMQHVESEAANMQDADKHLTVVAAEEELVSKSDGQPQPKTTSSEARETTPITISQVSLAAEASTTTHSPTRLQREGNAPQSDTKVEQAINVAPPLLQSSELPSTEHTHAVIEVSVPVTSQEPAPDHTESIPQQDPASEAREWETDSSPYESSSTDTDSSDDSSDSDASDDADGYTLLDPYEQARILMAEDGGGGGSDDEDDGSANRTSRPGGGAGLRTTNEKIEDILPKPTVIITEEMHVEELGTVEAIVENTLLIRAKISGEYQVLESGSVLCLADHSIVGAVAETLGRVEQPMYTVRFASQSEIEGSGLSEKGTKIYYVKEHSTFVFTQPLKAVKGSDASNFHDEEVGDDEMEFSDDEAEAEHKRQMKLRRKGIDPDTVPSGGRGRGRGKDRSGRGGRNADPRGGYRNPSFGTDAHTYSNGTNDVTMNYDDVEPGETSYTPLKRPETMGTLGAMSPPQLNTTIPPFQQSQNGQSNPRGGYDRNQHRGRGRGNFNNNRGRGRGNYNSYNTNHTTVSPTSDQPYAPPFPQPMQYQNFPANMAYNQPQSPNFTFQPPPPPALTPTRQGSFPNAFSPSPITPLPGSSFNFPTFPGYNMNQWPQSPHQQQPYGANSNAEAIAQVQRQLEELRRYGTQQ